MELEVRDWMIIIGVLLIVAVLLDGYRRVRNERRGNIRMSLNKQYLNAEDKEETASSELPNGGARVIGRSGPTGSQFTFAEPDMDDTLETGPSLGDGQLDLEQPVPMLVESVIANKSPRQDPAKPDELSSEAGEEPLDIVEAHESVARQVPAENSPEKAKIDTPGAANNPEEVLVINVAAKDGVFKGPDLLHILLACDLRFGDMEIFHRYEQANGSGAVQFSLANSVEPGTFNLDAIDDFSTPGVCFFMSVPGPDEPIKAFEYMVETAQCLVSNLNGEMLDESRSAMTNQTLEHCRQRLIDFERRQMVQHA